MPIKSHHPYRDLPEYTRWSNAVGRMPAAEVDPVVNFPFKIAASDKVATAGSCFAQHIARHLKANGFNYFVAEEAHPILNITPGLTQVYNYGTYSARYGNIYTSRQLVQTFRRAFGTFTPSEPVWRDDTGGFLDPFRPAIQPGGFATLEEFDRDRNQHMAAVRQMFVELDIFVFTLGLTEYWYCKDDGAALPVCPGVSGGVFDDQKYGFTNLGVKDVVADLEEFYGLLISVNPKAKIVMTVSPVPLAATAENRHVLVSTTYSKSVLRVAAELFSNAHDGVAYFPSYEVITGNFNRGAYYATNLREATEAGVSHVMRLFLRHATAGVVESKPNEHDIVNSAPDFYDQMQTVIDTVCEEALIEASIETEPGSVV